MDVHEGPAVEVTHGSCMVRDINKNIDGFYAMEVADGT